MAPPCPHFAICVNYKGGLPKPELLWDDMTDVTMERYRLDGTLEIVVSTVIDLQPGELDTLFSNHLTRRRYFESMLRSKIKVEHYKGNGGSDKLIGVIGRDNVIRYDDRYVPRLINIQRIL